MKVALQKAINNATNGNKISFFYNSLIFAQIKYEYVVHYIFTYHSFATVIYKNILRLNLNVFRYLSVVKMHEKYLGII